MRRFVVGSLLVASMTVLIVSMLFAYFHWNQRPSELALGNMYRLGDGVPKDYARAALWYRKAAERGNADAEFRLGNMYWNGDGLAKDDAQAAIWYRKAAEQGNTDALCSLGKMRLSGEGISRNSVLAYMLFNVAAGKGRPDAAKIRDEISQKFTREQLKEAQSLSSSWRVGLPLPEKTSPESMAPQDLFDGDDTVDRQTYSSSKTWISGIITINSNQFYVVLIETKDKDCHACGAKISAATYFREFGDQSNWELYSKELNFEELGSYGEAPVQPSEKINYLQLRSPDLGSILFIQDGFADQGKSKITSTCCGSMKAIRVGVGDRLELFRRATTIQVAIVPMNPRKSRSRHAILGPAISNLRLTKTGHGHACL